MLLSIYEVKPGMKLEQAISMPDSDKILLNAGATLTANNIDKIRSLGILDIHIADMYSVFVSPDDKISQALEDDFLHILTTLCPEHPSANMNDDIVKVAKTLRTLIKKISKISEILPFLFEMKITSNTYLYHHSLYTAVLSGLVAGCMKLTTEEIVYTIAGALLHNIGLCEMPMLIGSENLSGQQLDLYKEHPTYGYYFAIQKNIPRGIADCIHAHHEKWNGSGYPRGIAGEEIPVTARIVGMCSSYSAKITYKNTPRYMAVEELYGTSGIYYDPKVVNTFIENIPVYPLGEVVRLSTQEVGIVSNIRKNKGPRPLVKVYYNRVNRPITEDKIVDLGTERTIFIEEIL